MFKLPTILLLCTAACFAAAPQSNVRFEIRGVVTEPGTGVAVADAGISLAVQQGGPVRLNGGWKDDDTNKTRTDYRGAFVLTVDKAGEYRVTAGKDGYQAPGVAGASEFAEVKLTEEKPAVDVKLSLARHGRLTGSVIDEDTGEPLPRFRLSAVRRMAVGRFMSFGGVEGTTDAKGEFVISGLQPGEYAVTIGPQANDQARVRSKFTGRDAEAVDRDYERTYWPGGHGPETVLPLIVPSGGSVNVGRLAVRKVPYYRVHVRIPPSACNPGATLSIVESISGADSSILTHRLAQAPCGDLLVTGFPAGSYRLILTAAEETLGNEITASVPFLIADRNLEITADLKPGVAVSGSIVAAEGARPPDLSKVRIGFRPVDGQGSMQGLPAPPDADGRFHFENLRPLDHTVLVSGVSSGNYVKEIHHNDTALMSDTVPLGDGAPAHVLRIVHR